MNRQEIEKRIKANPALADDLPSTIAQILMDEGTPINVAIEIGKQHKRAVNIAECWKLYRMKHTFTQD